MTWSSFASSPRRLRAAVVGGALLAVMAGAVLIGIPAQGTQSSSVAPASFAPVSRVIGHSVKGRKIVATRYGDPEATRVVVAIGVIHGNEQGGLPIVRRLIASGAPAHTAMWIIPTVNPDGQVHYTRRNAHGVDLNRNTTDQWHKGPHDVFYPGPRARSEPETRAYMNFLARLRPDFVAIFHQHGNAIDSYNAKDPAIVAGLASRFGLPVKSFACSGVCHGTLTGWFNSSFPGSANTIELPAFVTNAKADRYSAGFLSESQVVPDH